ncbi:hypothetical protein Adt_02372 [Abeliophyllum distichum]|uniref:Uncharacterized protein n=1 Tax=Abeliophyllum distichum TaxID=126358 RepID=A0ABD1VVG0_9LAMI
MLPMINCSRLIATSEETHDILSNNTPTRGSSFNARTVQRRYLRSRASSTGTRPPCSLLLPWSTTSLKGLSHWDSATKQLAPPMEHNFAQGPLLLGLSHLAACSSHGAQLHSRASPTYYEKQDPPPT